MKPSSKNYSSKHDAKQDLRPSKSHGVEKLKGRDSKSSVMSAKEKVAKKVLRTKSGNGAPRVPHRIENPHMKQTEPVAASMELKPSTHRAQIEDNTDVEVKKHTDIQPVPQKHKVVSIFDLEFRDEYREPVGETLRGKKPASESVSQKETVEVDQKRATDNFEQRSHVKAKMAKTVVASKKVDEISPETPPALSASEHEKEEVDRAPAVIPTSPVRQHVSEKPLTVEVERVTNEKPEMLSVVTDECRETDSKPEPVQPEQTATQVVAGNVSTKNIAQVKPLLVANVPEKSKWEQDTDVSDGRETPMYVSGVRGRLAAAKTSLPR